MHNADTLATQMCSAGGWATTHQNAGEGRPPTTTHGVSGTPAQPCALLPAPQRLTQLSDDKVAHRTVLWNHFSGKWN